MKKFILFSVICIAANSNMFAQKLLVQATAPQVLFETITVGINEAKLESAVKVFPNPAVNEITLNLQQGYDLNFSELFVYDVTGKKVLHEKNPDFKNGTFILNIKGLEEGVYTLTLYTKNNRSAVNNKFIIRK